MSSHFLNWSEIQHFKLIFNMTTKLKTINIFLNLLFYGTIFRRTVKEIQPIEPIIQLIESLLYVCSICQDDRYPGPL